MIDISSTIDTESILNTVKRMIGPEASDTGFDVDLVVHINSVFSSLHHMGIGPANEFSITGPNENWSSFILPGVPLNMVKTYVYLKVKEIFDPPTSSTAADAIKRTIAELEWRMHSVCNYEEEQRNE